MFTDASGIYLMAVGCSPEDDHECDGHHGEGGHSHNHHNHAAGTAFLIEFLFQLARDSACNCM